jgi:hypothetical protein
MDVFEQLVVRYGRRLGGKVIVDPTNPVGPDGADGYRKVIGGQDWARSWPAWSRPGPGWSRRSARCRSHAVRGRSGNPSARRSLLTARAWPAAESSPEISGLNR